VCPDFDWVVGGGSSFPLGGHNSPRTIIWVRIVRVKSIIRIVITVVAIGVSPSPTPIRPSKAKPEVWITPISSMPSIVATMPSVAAMVAVVSAPTVIGSSMVTAIGMSTAVTMVAAGMKSSYGTTVESHATAAVKTPTSTMTTTLRKGILWRRAERDTGGDCSKNL
jgi:hypothetical protein